MLNIQYKEGSIWGCSNIVLSSDIHLCLIFYLFHTFPGDAVSQAHLYILLLLPSVSILFYSLCLLPSTLSLWFSSHLYLCLLLSLLPFSYWHPPNASLSHHPSLPFSLSPLLSPSLCCALMNCLPLPVNSTDNPGEAVKDHRSALQTGPQATAQEQHANNKPLHLVLSVCIYVHVCVILHMRLQELVFTCKHIHTRNKKRQHEQLSNLRLVKSCISIFFSAFLHTCEPHKIMSWRECCNTVSHCWLCFMCYV